MASGPLIRGSGDRRTLRKIGGKLATRNCADQCCDGGQYLEAKQCPGTPQNARVFVLASAVDSCYTWRVTWGVNWCYTVYPGISRLFTRAEALTLTDPGRVFETLSPADKGKDCCTCNPYGAPCTRTTTTPLVCGPGARFVNVIGPPVGPCCCSNKGKATENIRTRYEFFDLNGTLRRWEERVSEGTAQYDNAGVLIPGTSIGTTTETSFDRTRPPGNQTIVTTTPFIAQRVCGGLGFPILGGLCTGTFPYQAGQTSGTIVQTGSIVNACFTHTEDESSTTTQTNPTPGGVIQTYTGSASVVFEPLGDCGGGCDGASSLGGGLLAALPRAFWTPWAHTARVLFSTKEDAGVGDTIERLAKKFGIKWLAEKFPDCGCSGRRAKLNRLYPYC